MKFILAISLISINVQASYYFSTCSNSNATTRTYSGHTSKLNSVTSFKNGTSYQIKLDRRLTSIVSTDEITLSNENEVKCINDYQHSTSIKNYTKKITITNNNESHFDKSIHGVSKDLKSISTYVLCNQVMSSRPFPKKCKKN